MVAITKPDRAKAAAIAFRKAVPPEPRVYAQCRNCVQVVYDADDRCTKSGELTFHKINIRCKLHVCRVALGYVCDSHAFKNASRSDA